MLLSVGEFSENWHTEVLTSYYSGSEITLLRVPWEVTIFWKWRSPWQSLCTLSGGYTTCNLVFNPL